MAKKKLTANDVSKSLGVNHSLTGRKPQHPKAVDERLEQLIKESESWLRLAREVWFNPGEPLIADARGATELPQLSLHYDDAIESMRWIEASATYGLEILERGKAAAIRKASGNVKSTVASKRKTTTKAPRS